MPDSAQYWMPGSLDSPYYGSTGFYDGSRVAIIFFNRPVLTCSVARWDESLGGSAALALWRLKEAGKLGGGE